jgi:hypothetical protein
MDTSPRQSDDGMHAVLESSAHSGLINVFQFPFLTADECQSITKTVLDNRYRFPHDGSMQKHTVDATRVLGDLLYDRIVKQLMPTIRMLFDFGRTQSYSLYTAHAIIYSASGSGEKSLSLHVDDADITANITLQATDLSGCELWFRGTTEFGNDFCTKNLDKMRMKLDQAGQVTQISATVGNCILHRGCHPHSTSAICAGERIALVLWFRRNSKAIAAKRE